MIPNMKWIGVAVLVAVELIHPTVSVDVAAGLVTVMGPVKVRAPAAVVVAFPPTHKAPATDTFPVVDAFPNDERPVTPRVVDNVPDVPVNAPVRVRAPVEMSVVMVVAA